MRINKFVALATGLSRRRSDVVVAEGSVKINNVYASVGDVVSNKDVVTLNGITLTIKTSQTIMLNKPVGYICSRDGQGGKTIYQLLPPKYHHLKPVGRLDKDSSGLLLLTNDGDLAKELTHPRYQKVKVYEIELDHPLSRTNQQKIEHGIFLDDGYSKLNLSGNGNQWKVKMNEGRNRQIRRTFAALGYKVNRLHRIHFGEYELSNLHLGNFIVL